ncbi:MAG: LssY C-terminal domain-containing protein [Candidatus Solibacter usitatus]|nr:LssY C-terminal domain-containing protein [Candidatus Solibacter usitatus]
MLLRVPLLLSLASFVRASEIPAGEILHVRLTEAITSDRNSPADPVEAVLTQAYILDGIELLPARARVTGWVRRASAVGFGWKRERAVIDLEFDAIILEDGTRLPIRAKVSAVDNARETVNREGAIQGMRATATMQGTATSRLWHLPTLNPYPHPALMIHKAFFPYFPQPEIRLPPGTDLSIRLFEPVYTPDAQREVAASAQKPAPALVASLQSRIKTRKGKDSDILNLVVMGDEEELRQAFDAAGWSETRTTTMRSVLRAMRDVLENFVDPNAPMSRMFWNGRMPDLKFQKTLNTYAKRHHVRFWQLPYTEDGKHIWIGAGTHDTGVRFLWKKMHFTHGISPEIDKEREKIVADLRFPGCLSRDELWHRSGIPPMLRNADGGRIVTDGAMSMMDLKPCDHARIGSEEEHRLLARDDKPFLQRYLRRQILVVRHDFLRSNVFYGGVNLGRFLARSWSHHRQNVRTYGPLKEPKPAAAATALR